MKTVLQPVWNLGCGGGVAIILSVVAFSCSLTPAAAQSWPEISFTTPIGGFHHPTHLAIAHDGSGRLFVAEQSGVIRIVKNGSTLDTPFLDITGRSGTQGDQGLLSLAFSPDYASKMSAPITETGTFVQNPTPTPIP